MRNTTFLLLASSLLFACEGNDGTTPIPAVVEPDPTDPKPTDPQPEDPSSGACTSLANDATPVTAIDVVAISAPAPKGGAIPAGTFHLHGVTLYAGPGGKASSVPITLQATVKVTGNAVEQVLDGKRPDGTILAERTSETFTISGSEVAFTKTCDGDGSRTATFTATSSELTLFLVNEVGQTVAYEYR